MQHVERRKTSCPAGSSVCGFFLSVSVLRVTSRRPRNFRCFKCMKQKSRSGLQKAGVKLKTKQVSWGKQLEQSVAFFDVWARNNTTLCTIPSIMSVLEWIVHCFYRRRMLRHCLICGSLRVLRELAGLLLAFCAEFGVWCFPISPMCNPKEQNMNNCVF